ncbi:aldehyde dehydrogenase (NAD+) [Arthrobacter sp. V4I6]|uniref:aldehyde dehydrogenase family protein n=1 Tax=unclassified Arthrobacter TaxID=235627 RepID=UPI002780A648|nr:MULTISPECIES: aldehyde dehydrogenase family protein [unclassified Arthrobacter]MDQ0821416.1 aldehyde dehydrogenase (NAD+) [Arthrobacter sp. V1I7]MDQ0855682.1 aldehyde dehydrogenase (NAD+) [Arthrobacter sp. V4I6]
MNRTKMFIGGAWQETAQGTQRDLVNPATEEVFGQAVIATAEDAGPAVEAAHSALPAWSMTSGATRADLLERIARAWEGRGSEVALLVTQEMGMPLRDSAFNNVAGPVAVLRYYAGIARNVQLEERRAPFAFKGEVIVRKSPVGVVAAVVPWNYPLMLMATKLGPALAAGCTVVIKPAEENALSGYLVADIMAEAGVPPGVVNVVAGGPDFARALVAHPKVGKVAFTGSTPVGRSIAREVGGRLGSVNLELGGKSAAVVLDDADLVHTLSQLPPLSFLNAGQTCFAQTRVIATPNVYEEIVEGYRRYAKSQVLGSPLDEGTTMGPVVSGKQRQRINEYIEHGVSAGARLVSGGVTGEVPERGFYVRPTVFADVDNAWAVAQEEIFGPVVCIIRAKDEDDAVRIANDSPYGLAGSVWTGDVERGLALACLIEAGSFGINGYLPDMAAPWGGTKASGSGRENGPEAVDDFLRADTIYKFDGGAGPTA